MDIELDGRITETGQLEIELPPNLPPGHVRVRIMLESDACQTMLASETILAQDWDTPEEDEAWRLLKANC
ncbi:MAG: hypothetical protein JXA10_07590 [Anaerolineae bacterium]|nr:hypothetical protein [Anaerolineae bacterium]